MPGKRIGLMGTAALLLANAGCCEFWQRHCAPTQPVQYVPVQPAPACGCPTNYAPPPPVTGCPPGCAPSRGF
jgi:hypothetical protein